MTRFRSVVAMVIARDMPGRAALIASVLIHSSLAAQSVHFADRAVTEAVETITKEDIARHLGVIAADSMLGRDTPSPGLNQTARYVADQFKQFGLTPGGENGTWFQRYPAGRRVDFSQSRVIIAAGGQAAAVTYTLGVRLAVPLLPESLDSAGTIVVSGRLTEVFAQQAAVQGKVVLYVAPGRGWLDSVYSPALQALRYASRGLLILVDDGDSTAFARLPQATFQQSVVYTDPNWAAHVWVPATPALRSVLAAAGIDLAQARADTMPRARSLSALTVRFETSAKTVTAPNTVGILEGSDPQLKHEYIVFSAHMDHIGICNSGQADSVCNGADDDASGTAGVLALAQAFSRPGARPKRSMIFLTVSGEEKGLKGSTYFTDHPPVPIEQIVANLNMDMIGRNWKDSIVAIGKEQSDLGVTLDRVNAAHPELGMTAINDIWPEENFYYRSDHYMFARYGIPILFFFSGVHQDYHGMADSAEKIDTEKETRILRLIYYLGQEIGNASARPKPN